MAALALKCSSPASFYRHQPGPDAKLTFIGPATFRLEPTCYNAHRAVGIDITPGLSIETLAYRYALAHEGESSTSNSKYRAKLPQRKRESPKGHKQGSGGNLHDELDECFQHKSKNNTHRSENRRGQSHPNIPFVVVIFK